MCAPAPGAEVLVSYGPAYWRHKPKTEQAIQQQTERLAVTIKQENDAASTSTSSKRQLRSNGAAMAAKKTTLSKQAGLVEGTRLRVWWRTRKAWFDGTIGSAQVQDSVTIHRVDYDDGDIRWYDLRDPQHVWEPVRTDDAVEPGDGGDRKGTKRPRSQGAEASSGTVTSYKGADDGSTKRKHKATVSKDGQHSQCPLPHRFNISDEVAGLCGGGGTPWGWLPGTIIQLQSTSALVQYAWTNGDPPWMRKPAYTNLDCLSTATCPPLGAIIGNKKVGSLRAVRYSECAADPSNYVLLAGPTGRSHPRAQCVR